MRLKEKNKKQRDLHEATNAEEIFGRSKGARFHNSLCVGETQIAEVEVLIPGRDEEERKRAQQETASCPKWQRRAFSAVPGADTLRIVGREARDLDTYSRLVGVAGSPATSWRCC